MMNHPHIVTLNNTFQDDQNIYLCLEECAGGVSLFVGEVVQPADSELIFPVDDVVVDRT